MNNHVHERFVTNSQLLFNYLTELGYQEDSPIGNGLKKVRVFLFKDHKKVLSSNDYVGLYEISAENKFIQRYSGLTVSKDLLTFFTQREPFNI